ncbi:hypothetical protein ACR777_15070 [Sphingobacterium spiritivorum]|uniref:hypothetical protein n=1 Tax=Sphingobacterium spiritivorum TaxID=258 RepID=UPI003DA5441F
MAIELTREPGEVVFSKNPVVFGFQSNAKYSLLGQVFVGKFTFNSLGIVGSTFTLKYLNQELQFLISYNPDDSGFQLPAPLSGETLAQWTSKIIDALGKNYYINRDFLITSTASNNFVLTSKKADSDYNIAFSHTGAFMTYLVMQASVTRTIQPNFKVLAELWVQNYQTLKYEKYITSALETDDNGFALWDVSDQLTAALLANGHDNPNMSMTTFERTNKSVRNWFVRYAEMYGNSQKVRAVKQSVSKTAVLGGFSKAVMAERSFPGWFIRDNKNKWLDHSDNYRVLKPLQPDFLTIINFQQNYLSTSVNVKIYYSDNTLIEKVLKTFDSWNKYEKLIIPVGVYQNSLHLIDEEKVIARYEVWLESDDNVISDIYNIVVHYKYEAYLRFILFENSFGAYETKYLYGKKSNGYDIVQKNAKIINEKPFDLQTGDQIFYEVNLIDEETVNTGFMTRRQIRSFRDFFLSTDKYVFKNNRYYPISLASSNIKEFEDGNNMYALEFQLSSRYTEELWSDEGEEEAYAYSPDLSGYIPAPPAVPENFDDRYYLKTQTYNQAEIDSKILFIQNHVDLQISDVKENCDEIRILLNNKAEIDHTHPNYATMEEVSDMLADLSLFVGNWSSQEEGVDDGYYGGVFAIHKNQIWESVSEPNFEEPGTGDKWQKRIGGLNSSKLILNEDLVINWQTDIAPDKDGNPSGETYFQRFGNRTTWTAYYSVAGQEVSYTPAIGRTVENNNLKTLTIGDVSPGYIEFI